MDPNNPANGIQLYMTGSAAPTQCNELGLYSSWSFFPCAKEQGPLSVTLGIDCTANFTLSVHRASCTHCCNRWISMCVAVLLTAAVFAVCLCAVRLP